MDNDHYCFAKQVLPHKSLRTCMSLFILSLNLIFRYFRWLNSILNHRFNGIQYFSNYFLDFRPLYFFFFGGILLNFDFKNHTRSGLSSYTFQKKSMTLSFHFFFLLKSLRHHSCTKLTHEMVQQTPVVSSSSSRNIYIGYNFLVARDKCSHDKMN